MQRKARRCPSIVLAVVGIMLAVHSASAGMEGWLNDFAKAKAEAERTGRPILVNFSGSDWCGWCIRLDNEVLSKAAFKTYAKDNLVLFNADFPRNVKLPEKEAKQNEELAQQFGLQGFPTVLLVEADGKTVIARTGYRPGGPTGYVEHLAELIADHKANDSGAESAAEATTPKTPKPNQYDAENDRYWNADHGHWHPGRPSARDNR